MRAAHILTPLQAKIIAGAQVTAEGCWIWTAATTAGYGKVHRPNERTIQWAHRVSYEAFVGPVPDGLHLDHLCRTRPCVNPTHLEPVTQALNTQRGEPAGRPRCPAGHRYEGENLYIDTKGKRRCRLCATVARKRGPS